VAGPHENTELVSQRRVLEHQVGAAAVGQSAGPMSSRSRGPLSAQVDACGANSNRSIEDEQLANNSGRFL
jgi:hypothetical protein